MRQKLILWLAILAGAMPVVAQSPTPRTVTAPVTVVAPQSPVAELAADQNGPIRVVQEGPVRVVQSGPVTFTLPLGIWIAWLVSIATGLGAIAAIARYATKAATLVHNVSKYLSVVMDIAKEFKNDSGSTLKDSIDRIEVDAAAAKTNAGTAKTKADNLEKMLRDHVAYTKARDEIRSETAAEQRRDDKAERQQP